MLSRLVVVGCLVCSASRAQQPSQQVIDVYPHSMIHFTYSGRSGCALDGLGAWRLLLKANGWVEAGDTEVGPLGDEYRVILTWVLDPKSRKMWQWEVKSVRQNDGSERGSCRGYYSLRSTEMSASVPTNIAVDFRGHQRDPRDVVGPLLYTPPRYCKDTDCRALGIPTKNQVQTLLLVTSSTTPPAATAPARPTPPPPATPPRPPAAPTVAAPLVCDSGTVPCRCEQLSTCCRPGKCRCSPGPAQQGFAMCTP